MELIQILLGFSVLIFLIVIYTYNSLVRLRNDVEKTYSSIDVQIKRKVDLIPNLIEMVKGYMKHEKETLKMVIDARNAANEAAKATSGNPSDQNAMKDLQASEQKLQGAMMSFQALAEGYPDLKANTNNILDTKIASKLARSYSDNHSLKTLIKEFKNIDISKQFQSSDFGGELNSAQIKYCANDVIYLHEIHTKLEEILIREKRINLYNECLKFLTTRVDLDLAQFKEDIWSH